MFGRGLFCALIFKGIEVWVTLLVRVVRFYFSCKFRIEFYFCLR